MNQTANSGQPAKATASETGYPMRWAVYAFVLLFLLYLFDYLDRYVIVALYPFLKTDFGLTDAQCGLLMSGLVWTQVIVALPVGLLLDRWSRKKSIGIMSILWGIASLAGAVTTGFGQLLTTRCVVGVGEAGYGAGGTSIMSGIFKPNLRARMLGFWQAAVPLGTALGVMLGGLIATKYGWRSAIGIVAIPGILVAIMFFWVKDYKTVALTKSETKDDLPAAKKMSFADSIKELFRARSLIFVNIAFPLCMFGTSAVTTWLPSYFIRFGGMDVARASVTASIVTMMAVVGTPLGGYLTDVWVRKQMRARMLLPGVTTIATAILAAVAFMTTGTVQFIILLIWGLLALMYLPGMMAVTQDVVHPGLRSMSRSVNVFIQGIIGASLAPLVIGAISDAYGLDKAMWVVAPVVLVGGILFLWGAFFYKKDLDQCEKCQLTFEGQGG